MNQKITVMHIKNRASRHLFHIRWCGIVLSRLLSLRFSSTTHVQYLQRRNLSFVLWGQFQTPRMEAKSLLQVLGAVFDYCFISACSL